MRLEHIVALTASLGLASGDQVLGAKCGIKGNRILPAYYSTQQASFSVPAQCGALCLSQALCQSYAVENGNCRLYLLPVNKVLTKAMAGTNTFYDRGCATSSDMCQVNGSRSPRNQAFFSSAAVADNSFKACSTHCQNTIGCKAFSIELATGGKCRLYKNALVKDFNPDSNNVNIYWDINCPRSVADSGPSLGSYTPTVVVPSIATDPPAAVTFTENTAPTDVISTDSPDYTPSGPQVTPDDDDVFISTYTYEEYQLPTVVAQGSPPITTGLSQPTAIPTAPCMVQAGSQAQFVCRPMIPLEIP
ncbi:hypothetical protein M434DRAFT_391907 [Hypoxylon sp. CO27-5]|nr:hypothetical protein M434DRAFT_391907 [Hypoxylon sp. CO27-5]